MILKFILNYDNMTERFHLSILVGLQWSVKCKPLASTESNCFQVHVLIVIMPRCCQENHCRSSAGDEFKEGIILTSNTNSLSSFHSIFINTCNV
jgi:hypothetical protein